MAPESTVTHAVHGGGTHTEPPSDCDPRPPRDEQIPDLTDSISVQLGSTIALTSGARLTPPPAPIHIVGIVGRRPDIQMGRIATRWIVAAVQHPLTRGQGTVVGDLPGYAMRRQPSASGYSDFAVTPSAGPPRCQPRPAFIRATTINFRPKPISKGKARILPGHRAYSSVSDPGTLARRRGHFVSTFYHSVAVEVRP